MALKGLVRFFTFALILISLFQLSFTLFVRNAEKKHRAIAERQVKAADPSATGAAFKRLVEARQEAISDSMSGETVANFGFAKYSYAEAKEQELNLGLDLQGGMNVTLEVSLDELVRSMSNNPKDPALNAAINTANRKKANSQADFVTLFGESFPQGRALAPLFVKPNAQQAITLNSTNAQVLSQIRREARDAIQRTYKVLQTRIDKFGVAQPSVNLDESRGIITVELAGVRNPERVRNYLQSTANLQFFEVYSNQDILTTFDQANEALVAVLGGKPLTTDTANNSTSDTAGTGTTIAAATDTAGAKTDTGKTASLSDFTAAPKTADGKTDSNAIRQREAEQKYPLAMVWQVPVEIQRQKTPVVGYVLKKDTAKLRQYLEMPAVASKFPANVKFVYGAENAEARRDPNIPLALYALKTAPGGGSRLEGNHVTEARMDYNQLNGEPEVTMQMDYSGAQIWRKMTAEAATNRDHVAVVLDDRVYSAPVVNGEIPNGSTSISGSFTVEDATDLANILKSGKLPAPARIVQEQVVGPTLGAENIAAGMKSLGIAFLVIFLLMMVYYNTSGIVANIALVLNVLFTVGILSALHATLTMPGIAGLVLTIGMAVDANVIVFERIKEELALGKSYTDAVSLGYQRSLAPVLDGQVTQLLTAIILFVFGLGPVKGFATTQILGLLLSLFCGILVSRLITDFWTRKGRHFKYFTNVSKNFFQRANFKFIEKRKIAYVVSGIIFALGIASIFNGYDYGVEFAGGRSYTVRFDKQQQVDDVREKLAPYLGGERPLVKTIGTENALNITTPYLIGQPGPEAAAQVQSRLYEGLQKTGLIPAGVTREVFNTQYVRDQQTVLPTISDDLKKGAVWATVLSLAAIFLYILLRFRKWQYSIGTIIALLHDVAVTLAVFSFFRDIVPFSLEIDQHFIAAILTVIGFSMNDTVIVFDRIREYFRKSPNENKKSVINRAINDTLSRTVMTSLTVFLTILILFIFGGETTRGFAFAMLIGVITGTYSSIFVAAPILVDMDKTDSLAQEVDSEMRIEELKKLA